MYPLVDFPEIVQHYAPFFKGVFSEAAFIEFQRYISGLIVSENKTVEGINRLFVHESRNQSSLNRLLTASPFALEALGRARQAMLESVPETQMKEAGVWSVDDTLLTHFGQQFEQIAYLYDHTQQCYVWAHNLVTLHYSDEVTDYPLAFQLWKPADLAQLEQGLQAAGVPLKENKRVWRESDPPRWRQYLLGVWRRRQNRPGVAALYDSKLRIAEHLLQQAVEARPDLDAPITFDTWYTQPGFCRFIDRTLKRAYVGTLKGATPVLLQNGRVTLEDFAARLKQEHLAQPRAPVFKPIRIDFKGATEHYYSYCHTHRLPGFGKVRLVITHRQADLSDTPHFYICNRLRWQAAGITRIRRHRWPVEVYHEEGKAEGLDQYQLRRFEAIERHIALVAVVYCLLRTAQHDPVLHDTLQRQLQFELEGTPAFWRRATQAQTLWSLALFISAGLAHGQSLHSLMRPLLRAVCPA